MTTQDLSLLTDEERAANYAASTCLIMCGLDDSAVKTLTQALIAARAENKRKDEALRAALPVLEYIEKDQWSEAPPLGAKFDEADALVKVRAALLQSEKGGE